VTDPLAGDGYRKWLSELGVSDAPLVRTGLATALTFFHARMPSLSRHLRVAFLKGMDLHRPVLETTLRPPAVVAAFRKCNEDPFRVFYTRAGTALQALGLNPRDREFRRFRVVSPVLVLESRCAPARDTWTDAGHPVLASGGGIQYIIPESYRPLELIQ
jgi:hypothetical protein